VGDEDDGKPRWTEFALGHLSIEFRRGNADLTLVKRFLPRPSRLLEQLGLGRAAELHPALEDAIERNGERQNVALERRERTAELSLALLTLVASVLLAWFLPGGRAFDPALAVALVAACAVAYQVRFHDGGGYAVPTQLVVVPMLLLLPPGAVPLFVVGAMTLGNVSRALRGTLHPQRVAVGVGDAAHALAPALVLALAAPATPSWSALPIYALALGSQFALDLAIAVLRDWFVVGLGFDLELPLLAWTWLVDGILATIGLLAALAARDAPFGTLLVLPLIGLLHVFSRERSARIEQSIELSRAYRGTTLLLSDVLDEDDEYTAFHTRGVVQLSIAVADRLGLDERQRRNVEFGALLHDVGKIAIPKEILHKPGKLTPDEWVVMETHTIEGQRMLDRVGGVLGEVGQIVRSSHERWDGGGYPDGLAAAAIPLESSIVSVCDAFNAMTTDRPYRRALSLETAMSELRENRGTQFCPPAVDALIELIEENRSFVGPANVDEEIELLTVVPPAAAAAATR
jgi:HD-GYP domain-containing protein (c-di-GMP phosphodiesterase class II)